MLRYRNRIFRNRKVDPAVIILLNSNSIMLNAMDHPRTFYKGNEKRRETVGVIFEI